MIKWLVTESKFHQTLRKLGDIFKLFKVVGYQKTIKNDYKITSSQILPKFAVLLAGDDRSLI